MSKIVILGSGSWGTALALALHRREGHQLSLWSHSRDKATQIAAAGENAFFLPGVALPRSIAITADPAAVTHAEILVAAIPSEFLRATLDSLRPYFSAGQIIVSATKGIENHTHLRMTQLIASVVGEDRAGRSAQAVKAPGTAGVEAGMNPDTHAEVFTEDDAPEVSSSGIAPAPVPLNEIDQANQSAHGLHIGTLSGPSFAQEVAQAQPTAVTVAFEDAEIAARIQHEFSSETLRLYTSTDVIGVELGGALKNVIAIAAGVAAGMGLGANSAAALITRGIAEITRLAVACGGKRETLAGLSGVGDLVLTCTGALSRNRAVGEALGQGRKLPEILASLDGRVAEGVHTTRAALGLARQFEIEMPITEQMEQILIDGKDPREAIRDLMLRPGKHEH
jgi:glycerol-3-phosphate dehydrogenase (NAD(P)+)